MNMPKDTKGTAPEDVEAHGFRWGSDESQATERRDSGEDVEAHGRYYDAGQEGDVEGHSFRWGSDESQATERRDSGEDVEAHGFQRPRPEDGDGDGDGDELPRLRY